MIKRRFAVLLAAVMLTAACTEEPEPPVVPEVCDPAAEDVRSGEAIPREDLPGWTLKYVDDFSGCDLSDKWGAYSGQPGGDPASWWDPSQVSVIDGALRLRAENIDDRWVTGGVSNFAVTQQYGKWSIRMRADKSDEISYHILLWPQNEIWPPEIDIAESADGTRQEMSSFLHWSGDDGEHHFSQADVAVDTSDWHTIGVEWGPSEIRYLIDGRVWAKTPRDAQIPATPMWLGIQAQAGACSKLEEWGQGECGQAGTPDIADVQVDWVAVYDPAQPTVASTPESGDVTELTQRK